MEARNKKKDVKEYNKTAINDYISSSINFNDYKEEKTTNKLPNIDFVNEVTNQISKSKPKKKFLINYNVVGKIFDTYWLIESDNKVYLMDQHSAHEKVLYEEFLEKYKNKEVTSQILMQPISIVVDEEETSTINDNIDLLNKFGFEIESFGKNTFALRSVPVIFKNNLTDNFFMEIIENLKSTGKKYSNVYEANIEGIVRQACRSAIKANDKLSALDINNLLDKIGYLDNPFTCPHGRPTLIELSKYEIEKLFKRKM